MKQKLFAYEAQNTTIHNLSGLTKILCFLLLSFGVMFSFDIRYVTSVMCLAFFIFKMAHIELKRMRAIFTYILVFIFLDTALTFVFAPLYGVELYGTKHIIFPIYGDYVLTQEQLLYQSTKFLKYIAVIPLGLLFFLTTNPSEFASSLNKIGISYKIAYPVALTLRYFPDIQRSYREISQAQQARGLEISDKASVITRIKNAVLMIIPLIFSSIERVETISNAMDLRGFGKNKKRSWYAEKKLQKADYVALFICTSVFLTTIAFTLFVHGSRFWNPFMQ